MSAAITIDLQPTYAITIDLEGDGNTVTVSTDDAALELELLPALRGEQGVSGDGSIQLAFAWGDASPRTVVVATGGKLVYEVELHISHAFDGLGAQLKVGDAGQADRLMRVDQNDPAATGTYSSAPVLAYGVDTTILLTITPGVGATAGAGLLTLFIEQ
jgi:hypothetical protein